jgi:hypothetical protein
MLDNEKLVIIDIGRMIIHKPISLKVLHEIGGTMLNKPQNQDNHYDILQLGARSFNQSIDNYHYLGHLYDRATVTMNIIKTMFELKRNNPVLNRICELYPFHNNILIVDHYSNSTEIFYSPASSNTTTKPKTKLSRKLGITPTPPFDMLPNNIKRFYNLMKPGIQVFSILLDMMLNNSEKLTGQTFQQLVNKRIIYYGFQMIGYSKMTSENKTHIIKLIQVNNMVKATAISHGSPNTATRIQSGSGEKYTMMNSLPNTFATQLANAKANAKANANTNAKAYTETDYEKALNDLLFDVFKGSYADKMKLKEQYDISSLLQNTRYM